MLNKSRKLQVLEKLAMEGGDHSKIDARIKTLEGLGEDIKYLKKQSRGSWFVENSADMGFQARQIAKSLYPDKEHFNQEGAKGKLLAKHPIGSKFIPFGEQASSSRAHRALESERQKQLTALKAKKEMLVSSMSKSKK